MVVGAATSFCSSQCRITSCMAGTLSSATMRITKAINPPIISRRRWGIAIGIDRASAWFSQRSSLAQLPAQPSIESQLVRIQCRAQHYWQQLVAHMNHAELQLPRTKQASLQNLQLCASCYVTDHVSVCRHASGSQWCQHAVALRPPLPPLSTLLYGPDFLDDPSLGLGAGSPAWTQES